MNCEEVMEVLDNERLDRLEAERRRLVVAHVAVCPACARAWNLQTALAALPDAAAPDGFAAQCRAVVAAGSAPAAASRIRRPLRLVGAVASLAAVAAALIIALRPGPTQPDHDPRAVEVAMTPLAVEETMSPAPDPGMVPVAVAEAAPAAPQFTVRVLPLELPSAASPEVVQSIASEVLRANNADPGRERALHALHSAVVEELLKVPALSLVATDPVDSGSSRKHFRLKLGLLFMSGRDGRPMPVDGRYVDVALGAEEMQSGGKVVNHLGPTARIDIQANCFGAVSAETRCNDVPSVAAALIQTLFRDVFPPSPALTATLQARFQDESADITERLKALEELYELEARTGRGALMRDPGVVRAAIELAATADPAQRAQIWRSLRGAGNVELIQPLLASLAKDADDVRLAAVETLSADFPGDARVRAALEAAAVGDQRALVRAVAQRGLTGEEPWRQYVLSSLKDPELQPPQRVEALVHHLYPPGPTRATSSTVPGYFEAMQGLLDDDSVRALAEAIPDSDGLGRGANNLLGNFGSRYRTHPAVPEMMLRVLQGDPKPLMRAVAAQHLGRFHASEPKMREALVKARDNDPDARVREVIRDFVGSQSP